MSQLNRGALACCERMIAKAESLRISVSQVGANARIIDCGINASGGLEAGRLLADICMAGLASIQLAPSTLMPGLPAIVVSTDHPVMACMASQYAGWQISEGKYFAMASGPMRALAGKEAIFEKIGYREKAACAVGVLETRKFPPAEVANHIADACGVSPSELTLLVAPTASQAGNVQIVARSIETCLHKLSELGFDLSTIDSGWGEAPLPPVAADDLVGIGRTNDAILYGANVALWVRSRDEELEAIGPKVPACTSPDYGAPFSSVFERYNRDFYKIDPHLFSPARVTLVNRSTGRAFRFGRQSIEILERSFFGKAGD